MSSNAADMAQQREAARAAARWLALLEAGGASEQALAGLQRWRDSCASHEQAWQKAQALRQRFSGLPKALAMASLDRPQAERRRLLKGALGLAAVAPAVWLLGRELPLGNWRADLHTATGERRQFPLPDGGLLQLNTDSAVNLDLAARRVTLLQGEIALKVAGVEPFTVATGFGQVRMGQAEICVRRWPDRCQVSVLRGGVDVQALDGSTQGLRAGEQVLLRAGGMGAAQRFNADQPGWREGVLVAQNQPLGDFLRELDRYRPGLLRWHPALENLRVTGSFRLADTDQVLTLLAASLPLQVQSRTRYWVTLQPRETAG